MDNMNAPISFATPSAITMSSREIADMTSKQHSSVMRDIRVMLSQLSGEPIDNFTTEEMLKKQLHTVLYAGVFVAQYGANASGAPIYEYRLDRDHSYCLIAGYDALARMRIIKRWQQLESAVVQQVPQVTSTPAFDAIQVAGFLANDLRYSQSSKLSVYGAVLAQHGIPQAILPSYAIDAPVVAGGAQAASSKPTACAADLLKMAGVTLSAQRFNRLASDAGLIEKLQRRSTHGRQKQFWSVTELGLRYGKNVVSPACPRETAPHWYRDSFIEMLGDIAVTLKNRVPAVA